MTGAHENHGGTPDGERPLVLRGARVCDGSTAPRASALVIEAGRIKALLSPEEAEKSMPAGARVIDLEGHVVTPGLIDAHTHLLMVGAVDQDFGYERELLMDSLPLRTLRAAAHARGMLDHGFTTVRDVCTEGAGYADVALRDAIRAGVCEGPTVLPSGPGIAITGGYLPRGYAPGVCAPMGCSICDGSDAIRREVRTQVSHGVAWIKVFADWPCSHPVARGREVRPTFDRAEMQALVDEAGRRGRRVAAHVTSDAGARQAIECGVASLEHLGPLTQQTLELAAAREVPIVPTLSVIAHHLDAAPPGAKDGAKRELELVAGTFKRALEAGVRIVCGSDIGAYPHQAGSLSELRWMMAFGMSPERALRAATGEAARLLELEGVGRIEVDAVADLCVFRAAEPFDLGVALTGARPVLVLKEGRVVRDRRREG